MIMRFVGSMPTMSPRMAISSSLVRSAAYDEVARIDRLATPAAAIIDLQEDVDMELSPSGRAQFSRREGAGARRRLSGAAQSCSGPHLPLLPRHVFDLHQTAAENGRSRIRRA